MKISYYNHFVEYDGDLLVCNTASGSFVKFQGNSRREVLKVLKDGIKTDINAKLMSFLAKNGFLVSETVDEDEEVEKALDWNKHNQGHLDLTLMPTMACNFRCVYCYEDHAEISMSDQTENSIVRFVDQNIDQYRGLSIEWFGGEPLCALDRVISLSEKLLAVCNTHKKPYHANMTTNGYLLTPDVFNLLYRLKVTHFQITVDGLADTHDLQKPYFDGSPTFQTVMNNLIAIRDMNRKGMYDFIIRTNFTRKMLDGAKKYADFLATHFSNNIHFGIFWRVVGDYGGENVKNIRDLLIHDISDLNEVRMYAAKIGLHSPVNRDFMSLSGSVCYAATYNSFIISPLGEVMKCTTNLDDSRNHVGFIDDKGRMILNDNYHLWTQAKKCDISKCKNRPTCGGKSCPMVTITRGQHLCPWDDVHIIDEMKILSHSPYTIELYKEEV